MHGPVTGQVYAIYYLGLAIVGVPINLLAIVILSRGKCGLSKCITHYLVSMAASDLMVIINGVILNRVRANYFPGSFLDLTPIFGLRMVLLFSCMDISVWLTVSFTFDRVVAICCQRLKANYCTQRVAVKVIASVCIFFSLKNIPFYFTCKASYVVGNMQWGCDLVSDYYTSWVWAVFDWIRYIFTPLLSCFLMLLLNVLTVRHIIVANRARKRIRGHSNGENEKDLEMESRRKSIILLFSISGSFILLWTPYVIQFLYYRITNAYIIDPQNPMYIFREASFTLLLLSCCTNTGIYTVTQTKFRHELKNALRYPVHQIIRILK